MSTLGPQGRSELWKLLLVAALPTLVALGAVEGLSRVELWLRHGYSYVDSLAYVPDGELVFHNNPRHHEWGRDPSRRYDFFFIPPLAVSNPAPRVWVLGESTSAARPDGSDWPAVFQNLVLEARGTPVRVVNMGHEGYGIGHIRWLYHHYREKVNPVAIIIFSGWNYRGIVSSPVFSYRPVNSCSRFDGWFQCLSAFLINHSAAYGRLFHLVQRLRQLSGSTDRCGSPLPPYPELAQWEEEYRETVSGMAREHRVFLVLFPGLVMRDDASPELLLRFRCIAEHFVVHRAEYVARIAVIRRIGQELRLPLLDARSAYLGLPPRAHVSLFTDLAHQTPEGNRLLAKAIHAEFMRAMR